MKNSILFLINTPAQAHTWKNIIYKLREHGYSINVLARNYGQTLELLDRFGIEYKSFKTIKSRYLKNIVILLHISHGVKLAFYTRPNLIVGFGVDAALLGFILRKKSLILTDDDPLHLENRIIKMFANTIITPSSFREYLGKKHIRKPIYKELAYLHPNHFKADPSIFNDLKINPDAKYVIFRFNVFDAGHDINRHGFSISDKARLVAELQKYAHVFISPEDQLPDELEQYRLPINSDRIHDALFFAQMLVTDSQTMTTEAAVLGTPVVRCNSFVGPNDASNYLELEEKYGMIYSFQNSEYAIKKSLELIQQKNIKQDWEEKRHRLLGDKVDVTQFMVNFIENINY
jgi:predicted glycosyltransferase